MNAAIGRLISRLAFIFATLTTNALAHDCKTVSLYSNFVYGPIDFQDMKIYEPFNSVLFLADSTTHRIGLAERVNAAYPEKRVVKTDIEIIGKTEYGNLTKQFLDNNEPFPFSENEFDGVIMKKGLCFCSELISCGGIKPTLSCALKFFGEVARVLNKKNPKARAILHGFDIEPKILTLWNEAAQQIMKKERVQFQLMTDREGDFDSIHIYPSSEPIVEQASSQN